MDLPKSSYNSPTPRRWLYARPCLSPGFTALQSRPLWLTETHFLSPRHSDHAIRPAYVHTYLLLFKSILCLSWHCRSWDGRFRFWLMLCYLNWINSRVWVVRLNRREICIVSQALWIKAQIRHSLCLECLQGNKVNKQSQVGTMDALEERGLHRMPWTQEVQPTALRESESLVSGTSRCSPRWQRWAKGKSGQSLKLLRSHHKYGD